MTTLYDMITDDEKRKLSLDFEKDVKLMGKVRAYKFEMILPGVVTRVEIKCTPAALDALVKMYHEGVKAAQGDPLDRPIINVIDAE